MSAGAATRSDQRSLRRHAVVLGVVLGGLAVTAAAVFLVHRNAQHMATQQTAQVLDETADDLQRRVDRSDEVVASVANLFMTMGAVSEEQFEEFVLPRLAEHSEFRAVQYQEHLTAAERADFEGRLVAAGHEGGLVEPAEGGGVQPAAGRDDHVAVLYNQPEAPNSVAFGLDIMARPHVAELVERIRDTGELGATPSVRIVQGDDLHAMHLYRPIYESGMPTSTVGQRREAFRGLAAAAVLYPELVEASLADEVDELDFVLTDPAGGEDGSAEPPVIFAAEGGEFHNASSAASVAEGIDTDSAETATVELAGRELELAAVPTPELVASYAQPAQNIVLALGLLMTAMAGLLAARWMRGSRFERLAAELEDANVRLVESARRMREAVATDHLTGLPNRSSLHEEVLQRVADDPTSPLTVTIVNLDRFKVLNESIGHRHGDQLLQQVAARLIAAVEPDVLIGRLGGDEFAVVQSGVPAAEVGTSVERLLGTVGRPYRIGQRTLHLGATAATCSYPADVASASDLLRNADLALHEAKRTRRGGWVPYDAAMAESVAEREWMERELRMALDEAEQRGATDAVPQGLTLGFQPILDLRSGEIVGAEALARWTHPDRGVVSPVQFIPIAEDSGLVVRLGEVMLRRVCETLRMCIDRGLPLRSISLNVSAQQLVGSAFVQSVRRELDRWEVPATMLVLEVTETVAMEDLEDTEIVDQLQALRDLGVIISIDDFGTGYSSMTRLARLPVGELKVDQAFVAGLPHDRSCTGIARAIVSMGHTLGLRLVAEGVETADQLAWLRSEGCDQAQGWLFSRAEPLEAFLDRVTPRL